MRIGEISPTITQTNVNTQVDVAMLSKSLDTEKTTGDNLVKMMEQSVYPNLGTNLDLYV